MEPKDVSDSGSQTGLPPDTQDDIKIVKEISIADHLRIHEAISRSQRDNWSHYIGLAMLMLIGAGGFALILIPASDKVIDFATHTLTTIVGGLIAYLYIKK